MFCGKYIWKMWSFQKNFFQILSITFILIAECRCLRDVRVVVPIAVRRGDNAALRCQYDIESDMLYSVKWYRGDREFYRFVPRENPVMKVFPIPGLNVLKKYSNASVVTLDTVDTAAAGRYSCEVSADAPSFLTYMVTAIMDVVDIPAHRPVITGVMPRYRSGALLRGNCTCKHSRPAANLTWFINGQHVNPSYLKRYRSPEFTNAEGLQTAVLGIHFLISPQHFATGKLKIRCTASMYGVYWQSTEKSVEEERVRGGNSALPGLSGVDGAAPESQHVALMYPVHGTAYDADPPPARDASHALGAATRSRTEASEALLCAALLGCLKSLFLRELYSLR